MTIVNSFLSWYMKKRMHQIELFMKYPDEVQEEWFASLVNDSMNTQWGKKYDYRTIENVNQFKERIPVQNYDSLKPYINQMLNGEQNVLWPSEIKWFAKSSGTTSDRSKFIPVSEESLEDCHFRGGKDMLAIYCNNMPNAQMFTGKSLVLGGSHQINQLSPDSFYGDLSAVIIKNLPFLLSDTVGFIRKLPTQLIESFKSTLDEVREADLLLHVVDISHPDFEEHIDSVNQILQDIKSNDKPTIMVFNKIDAYKHLVIEADDLITEKTTKHYTLEEWKTTWMHNVGEKNALFISATNKENFEEFREKVYEAVREIHITRFPYNKFLYPDYKDALEE